MVQEGDNATSGKLTDIIEKLLDERSRILSERSISINHIWNLPIIINPSIGFMVEISEKLLVTLDNKYDRSIIINDIVRYVYSEVEKKLVGEDEEDEDVVLQ